MCDQDCGINHYCDAIGFCLPCQSLCIKGAGRPLQEACVRKCPDYLETLTTTSTTSTPVSVSAPVSVPAFDVEPQPVIFNSSENFGHPIGIAMTCIAVFLALVIIIGFVVYKIIQRNKNKRKFDRTKKGLPVAEPSNDRTELQEQAGMLQADSMV